MLWQLVHLSPPRTWHLKRNLFSSPPSFFLKQYIGWVCASARRGAAEQRGRWCLHGLSLRSYSTKHLGSPGSSHRTRRRAVESGVLGIQLIYLRRRTNRRDESRKRQISAAILQSLSFSKHFFLFTLHIPEFVWVARRTWQLFVPSEASRGMGGTLGMNRSSQAPLNSVPTSLPASLWTIHY